MKRRLMKIKVVFILTGILFCAVLNAATNDDYCCSVPYDKEFLCTDLPYNFDPENTAQLQQLFGKPTQYGTCWIDFWEEISPKLELTSCRTGVITRRFKILPKNYEGTPITCEQKVYLIGVHDYAIKFPEDEAAFCSVPSPKTIEVVENECDLLSVSVRDERFTASSDECYKILRTYRVINWCEMDPENTKAIVISRDEDCDGNPGDEPVWVIRRANGNVYVDRDNNERNKIPSGAELDESCGREDHYTEGYWRTFYIGPESPTYSRRGFWQYTQIIKVYDDKAPQLSVGALEPFCSINSTTCAGNVRIPFSATETCTPDDVKIRVYFLKNEKPVSYIPENEVTASVLSGSYPDYMLTGQYPLGTHAFEVLADDGCGNTGLIKITFEVKDCSGPSPICIDMLSVNLMPVFDDNRNLVGGMAVVWAEDFVTSEVYDCNGPVTFSIHRRDMVDEGMELPDPNQASIEMTCADGEILPVYIYSWDAVGNHGKCVAAIRATDNLFTCSPATSSVIAGQIMTSSGKIVDGVMVQLLGNSNNQVITQENGFYVFGDLQQGSFYSVKPYKNDDPVNGVNTMDLIRIKKHILYTSRLESPYQIIAADANNSGNVSAIDLIRLRRLILSIDDAFENNTSWRFIDGHHEFTDPQNPFLTPFPESIDIETMEGKRLDMNFVAVKVGDVTGDAIANKTEIVEPRSEFVKGFNLKDEILEKGASTVLDFNLFPEDQVAACQFTLNIDPDFFSAGNVKFGEGVSAENFNLDYLKDGLLAFSWNTDDGENWEDGSKTLFSLEITANQTVAIKNHITLSSRLAAASVFKSDGSTGQLALNWSAKSVSFAGEGFRLLPNYPNPFKDFTNIRFYLPETETVVLSVFSADGKLLKVVKQDMAPGEQSIRLDNSQLSEGLLIYKIQAGKYQGSGKLIY